MLKNLIKRTQEQTDQAQIYSKIFAWQGMVPDLQFCLEKYSPQIYQETLLGSVWDFEIQYFNTLSHNVVYEG